MNHKLVNSIQMWNVNGNTTTLLHSLKGFEILHQERREQVNTILMEHFNSIVFHMARHVNNQHTYKSINASEIPALHVTPFCKKLDIVNQYSIPLALFLFPIF
jgi:hypothetical protein